MSIRAQKRVTWKALKRWIKSRSLGDKEELKKERRRLKEIMRAKREEELERKRKS